MQKPDYALDLPPLSPCTDDLCLPAFPTEPDYAELEDTAHTALFVVTCTYTLPQPHPTVLKTEHPKAIICERDAKNRKEKLERYRRKRARRRYSHKVAYECRKTVADRRLRVKGRFVTKQEELSLRTNSD